MRSNRNNLVFYKSIDVERTVPIYSSFLPMKYELARLKETEYEIMCEGEDLTIQDMLFDLHNILWILSDQKLLRFNEPGSFEEIYRLPTSTGLFTTIAVDHTNTLWIGGLQTGLFKFDGKSWVHYTTSNSTLPTNSMTKIFVDQNNIIWVALWDHQGILKIDGSNWLYYNFQNSNITQHNIWSLTVDHQAHLWIGTGWDVPALSLMKFDGKDWEPIMLTDSRGNMLIGTVRYLATDHAGKIWAISVGESYTPNKLNAVLVFDGEHWQQNTVVPMNQYVSGLLVDPKNHIWISTLNHGTYEIEQERGK